MYQKNNEPEPCPSGKHDLDPPYYEDDGKVRIAICRKCGFKIVDHLITEDVLDSGR